MNPAQEVKDNNIGNRIFRSGRLDLFMDAIAANYRFDIDDLKSSIVVLTMKLEFGLAEKLLVSYEADLQSYYKKLIEDLAETLKTLEAGVTFSKYEARTYVKLKESISSISEKLKITDF